MIEDENDNIDFWIKDGAELYASGAYKTEEEMSEVINTNLKLGGECIEILKDIKGHIENYKWD